jgi:vacuolar-type H+-ATPase subunit I/STV1
MPEDKPFLEDLPECPEEIETETVVEDIDVLKKAQEFAELNEEKRQLKDKLAKVEAKMKAIDEQICEKMIFEHPNIKVRVGFDAKGRPKFKTVFVSETLWAGYLGETNTELLEAMKAAGLADMVSESFNTQSLSAYVRGFDPDGILSLEEVKELLPEPIQPHIKLTKKVNVKVKS